MPTQMTVVQIVELARRLETIDADNNAGYARARAATDPASQSQVIAIGDGTAVYTGPGSPINRVHGLGMARSVDEAAVGAAEHFFNARHLPAAIDLCPLADESLMRVLATRGYAVSGFKHVFHRELEHLDDCPIPSTRIRVARVDAAQATLWAEVVAGAFAGNELGDAQGIRFALPNVFAAHSLCFLAWVDEMPAGGGAMTMVDGTAICYSTSVRPALRRMGVQTALLAARLAYARRAGADLAVVQTTPGSASACNVRRFGFHLAYTKPTVTQNLRGPIEVGHAV